MRTVIGENSDAQYQLDAEIGSGAQGRVFSVKGGKYAFKLIGKKSSKNAQLLKRKISYIKTRNISDLNISKPIEQVKGEYLGYIMEMATDMVPLEKLLKPTSDSEWWGKSGGLRKRLLILKNLSQLLSDLHSRGLIYGDLSPNNIFVSEDKEYAEVYLIDVDNITHESKIGDAFYTPGYGAPEVVKGNSGSDTYTDDYSFSVIAYQLLTLNHPFVGDYVNQGDPELEEDAYMGNIPWIEHSTNKINKSTTGLDSSLTLSKMIKKEFINSFEINILNKIKRTTTSKWNEILIKSLTGILQCHNCDNTFFYNPELCCSFCNEIKKSIGIVQIHQLNATIKNELKEKYPLIAFDKVKDVGQTIGRKLGSLGEYVSITENDLFLNKSESILFQIKMEENYNFIKGIDQQAITVFTKGEIKEGINIENETKISQGDWLIFSKDLKEGYQRVIKVGRYSI
jgi:eukaryotic-like serine/threonine-protein kinase